MSAVALIHVMFSRRWWWTTLLVIIAAAVMVRLGFWQIDRHQQRQAFNTHVRAMQAMPPLILDGQALPADLIDMEYRAVEAVGTYDFEHQVAIRNQVWTQSWGDEMGYALLTPLVLEDGSAVLAERGWIPAQYGTPQSWRQLDKVGVVTVTGVIRLPLEKGEMGSVQDPTPIPGRAGLDFWNFVNIERLQQQMPYPLLSVYVQCAPDESQVAPPYCGAPKLDLTEGAHLGYTTQWFFYTALLLLGYPVYLRRQSLSPSPNPHPPES